MRRSPNAAKRASAVIVLCASFALGAPAQTFTTLFSFPASNAGPYAGLVKNKMLFGAVFFRRTVLRWRASRRLEPVPERTACSCYGGTARAVVVLREAPVIFREPA